MDELNSKELLEEVLKSEIEGLSYWAQGSKEHSEAINNIATLYKLKIDETKSELDADIKYRVNECEYQVKCDQAFEQKKDRYIRLGMDVAGLLLPLLFYGSWMRRGFRFEETGTFTSTTFRGLFNRFKPTGK